MRHAPELCLLVLLALTAVVIGMQHRIFGRDIVIAPTTVHAYGFDGYADNVSGGASVYVPSQDPLKWSCDLKPGASSLFCGQEVVFDHASVGAGIDLRTLESLTLSLDYHGPATTLRIYLKNHDPRYSKATDRSTAKVNKIEVSVHEGRQTIVVHPTEFSVADWWLSGKHFAPELGRTQLDNVVAVEISTGTGAPAGHYAFDLRWAKLRRTGVTPSQLYLGIFATWAALIALYLLIRVRRARNDQLEKERAQAEVRAALAAAKHAAERASQAKSDFLASMSHELRTPLNAVLGYAQLLERAELAEKHRAAVRTIRRSGNHLLSLITDVLDLSKIEAGKMELHCAPTKLRSVIGAVSEMIGVRAAEKDLVFSCVVGEDVPEAVEADEKRLRQILLNLLSNAVKFTTEGRVTLAVSLLDRAETTATLRFEVQDSGPGIAEDELERIFRPFEQVGEVQRREGGTGLGLAICQQLAALMGSRIEVQSRLGHGASFWFEARFPIAEAPAEDAACQAAEVVGYVGPRRRVLVVDDNEANRDLLCDLLQQLGFSTDMACDGREAVQLAQQVHPDLILMDLKMPVMDGHEATRLMRLIEPLKATPILAVSANNADEARASSAAAGADGFVSKPIDNAELFAAIARVLSLEWITSSGRTPRRRTAAAAAPATPVPAPLRILAAEDNPTNQLVLQTMLQELDVELTLVGDGMDAVRAIQDRGFDLVLMDVQMPQMGGVEATQAIREHEARHGLRRTPIVALSANEAADHLAGYLAAGMDGHLDKPIEIERLYALLDQVAAGAFLDPALPA